MTDRTTLVSRVDAAGDRILEPLRENRATSAVFGLASTVGDFSIIWHVIGLVRAIGSVDRLQQALFLSAALGVESLIINQGVKRAFRRERPTTSGDDRFDVRTPSTSSFPSGHASSATFATFVLSHFVGWPLSWVFVAIAAIVALSRVVVRIHHLSDILGGIAFGAVLGVVGRVAASAVLG